MHSYRKFADEERCLLSVQADELRLRELERDFAQVLQWGVNSHTVTAVRAHPGGKGAEYHVHDLAPLKVVVEEVAHDQLHARDLLQELFLNNLTGCTQPQ